MKRTDDKQRLLSILKQGDFIPYNLIGTIENKKDASIYYDASTQSVWVNKGYFNYVYGDTGTICNHLSSLKEGEHGFSGVHKSVAKAIIAQSFLMWLEPTERYIHTSQLRPYTSSHTVVDIPYHEAKGIDNNYEYKDETTLEMIKSDIKRGPTSGLYIDGTLVSYAILHDDNTIGYMYTLKAYRGQGLAYDVAYDIVSKVKAQNKVACIEIVKTNYKSQALAKKIGFKKDAYTPWFGIIKGKPCPSEYTWLLDLVGHCRFTTHAQLRYNEPIYQTKFNIKIDAKGEDKYIYADADCEYFEVLLIHLKNNFYHVKCLKAQQINLESILRVIGQQTLFKQMHYVIAKDERTTQILKTVVL